jgi:hypothetical protein
MLQLKEVYTLVPALPGLDYWSIAITMVALNNGNNDKLTRKAALLAAALAQPPCLFTLSRSPSTSPSGASTKEEGEAAPVASLRRHLVTEAALDPALVELLLVLLQHCLAAVAPLGQAPPLVNPALAAIDPYQAVVTYLASKGIPELLPGEWLGAGGQGDWRVDSRTKQAGRGQEGLGGTAVCLFCFVLLQ